MIWPSDLVNAALFYTLHDHSPSDPAKTNGWRIGRYKWFLFIFTGSFIWYWFPGWIFQGLSFFAFVTWIKPDSIIVNQLFGNFYGYGLIPISFVSSHTLPILTLGFIFVSLVLTDYSGLVRHLRLAYFSSHSPILGHRQHHRRRCCFLHHPLLRCSVLQHVVLRIPARVQHGRIR